MASYKIGFEFVLCIVREHKKTQLALFPRKQLTQKALKTRTFVSEIFDVE